ncbi:MAG: glutathione S-transferase [Cyanobacteria bacterium SW_9_44_58]|nr:MAG: glutathione S-transferase [Cyanobacteria bacterium SW_9_44_58]
MKLYDYETAPSPRKVRIFLVKKGIELETISVNLPQKEQFADWYRQKNPNCTVPSLELNDGTVLCESEAICHYLEEIYPNPPLFGRSTMERAFVNEWLQRIDFEGYLPVANFIRNCSDAFKDRALPGPKPVAQIPELAERERDRAQQFFYTINDILESNNPWLLGKYFSILDIFAFVTLEFADKCQLQPEEELNALEIWLQKMRDSLEATN